MSDDKNRPCGLCGAPIDGHVVTNSNGYLEPACVRMVPQWLKDKLEAEEANKETLRDRFAMAALTGFLAGNWRDPGGVSTPDIWAENAFAVADEMLAARVAKLVIVPAPGDRCGNTKALEDGSPCPGCRACS